MNNLVKSVETRKVLTKDRNIGDKIDAVLTNKWLGILIFAIVMWLVFQISQVWVGTPVADWLVALLEDCGYMSRVAVVLDPIFKKVGLLGKSVIPFVITIGCAVHGIMASRTIRNDRERRATAMLSPFMPCGAKIPVIALFAGAFFDDAGWVSTVMYLSGIVLIFLGALLVNKIAGYKSRRAFFIIEL